jgi:hypothetical protein
MSADASGKLFYFSKPFERHPLIFLALVQMFGDLATYPLVAIYCHDELGETVNSKKVRELRIKTVNESRNTDKMCPQDYNDNNQQFPR